MKKQFAVLALCLTVTMTNNAYSMGEKDEATSVLRHRGKQSQPQEQEPFVRHVAPSFQLSDLNPYYWSPRTKCMVAVGISTCTLVGWGIYKLIAMIETYQADMRTRMANRPKECNPSLNYDIECDSHSCHLIPESSTSAEFLEFILQETIRNATNTVCRYLAQTSSCNISADFVYDKACLQEVMLKKY